MTTASAIQPRTIAERIAWAKANLFNSKGNTVLTLFSVGAGAVLLFLIVRYVLFQANWGLVALNRRLFFVGSYPSDEMVRIWIAVFLVVGLISITYGVWAGRLRPYLMVIAVMAAIVLTLGLGTEVRVEERQFSDVIESAGQSTTVSGINKVLVVDRGWAPSWLYAISLGLAVPFGSTWVLMAVCIRDTGRRGVGRQAPGEMAGQPDHAAGIGRIVGAAHSNNCAIAAWRIQQ